MQDTHLYVFDPLNERTVGGEKARGKAEKLPKEEQMNAQSLDQMTEKVTDQILRSPDEKRPTTHAKKKASWEPGELLILNHV